jgi:hypothetical protein
MGIGSYRGAWAARPMTKERSAMMNFCMYVTSEREGDGARVGKRGRRQRPGRRRRETLAAPSSGCRCRQDREWKLASAGSEALEMQ